MLRLTVIAAAAAAAVASCVSRGTHAGDCGVGLVGAVDVSIGADASAAGGGAVSLAPAVKQIALGDFGCDSNSDCVSDGTCVEGECLENCVSSGDCPGAAADTRWQTCAGAGDNSCGDGFVCAIAGGGGDFRCVLLLPPGGDCGRSPAVGCDNSKGMFCSSGGPTLRCLYRRKSGEACADADNLSICEQGLACRNREDGTSNVESGGGVCGEVVGGRGSQCSLDNFRFCTERETTSFGPGRATEMRTVCMDDMCVESDVLVLGDYCGSSKKAGAECDACEGLVCSDLEDAVLNEDFARCLRRDPAVRSVGRGCGIPFWSPLISSNELSENDEALACVSKSKKAGAPCKLTDVFSREYVVCEDGLECVNGVCA